MNNSDIQNNQSVPELPPPVVPKPEAPAKKPAKTPLYGEMSFCCIWFIVSVYAIFWSAKDFLEDCKKTFFLFPLLLSITASSGLLGIIFNGTGIVKALRGQRDMLLIICITGMIFSLISIIVSLIFTYFRDFDITPAG